MQFYKKNLAGGKWQRNPYFSLLLLFRDCLVFILPLRRIPAPIVRLLYGVTPNFVFFVHARRLEDVYVGMPALVPLRKFLKRSRFLKILAFLPPVVIDTVRTQQGIEGVVLSSAFPSEILLQDRKIALRESIRALFFSSKIGTKDMVFGLGGLWPMVTRRGLALMPYAKSKGITVTNGHCGTLVSLFLSIKKLAGMSAIPLENLKIVILGTGKMGSNLARALYGKVAALTLVDINESRLALVEKELQETMYHTDIQKYNNKNDTGGLKDIFSKNHIAVCTTSNLTRILKPGQIPENTIIIDDSRPEGMPRELKTDKKIILEGGLMKITGLRQKYDFGFGIDENVFGCLAESFLLAADKSGSLRSTLGRVDFANFQRMISLCGELGVSVGDFKCRQEYIGNDKLISVLQSKKGLRATIPFKNICWLLKVEELA